MRCIPLVLSFIIALLAPGYTQEPHLTGGYSEETPSTAGQSETCVDVEIGGNRYYNCLNRELERRVGQMKPVDNLAPVGTRSADIHVGIVSEPALKQQYGRNYGRSVVPYRPETQFANPLGR